MAHKHSVYDTDNHFMIDGVTRAIKNASQSKVMVVQGDHNSERFTFEIPRYTDGHDMSACNVVQVHYLNIDSITKEQNPGIYEIDDLQISPEGDDVVICSWLISGNATKYIGTLFFVVRFSCVSDDGTIDYVWNTAKHNNVYITEGIYNGEYIEEEYADILAQWKQELIDAGVDALTLDKTLLVEGEAADARAAGDAIRAVDKQVKNLAEKALLYQESGTQTQITSNNLYNPDEAELGGYYYWSDAKWTHREDIASTGFIACRSGDTFVSARAGTTFGGNVTFYDENRVYVSGVNANQTPFIVPENDNIRYFRISFYSSIANLQYQVNKDEIKEYDQYREEIIVTPEGYIAGHDVIAPNITEIKTGLSEVEKEVSGANLPALKESVSDMERAVSDMEKTLTASEAKEEIQITSNNLYNPEDAERYGYYAWNTGNWVERSDIASTGFIACESGQSFYAVYNTNTLGGNVTFYSENHEYLVGVDCVKTPFVVPDNENIRYFRISFYGGVGADNAFNGYQINRDEVKPYDAYKEELVVFPGGYVFDDNVIAPNITELEAKVKAHEEQLAKENESAAANVLYYSQHYKDSVTVMHKRNKEVGTSYWLFIINAKNFDGSTVKPVIVGTDDTNPLGGSSVTNVTDFAVKHDYLHVVNGGIFLVASNEADGITIIDGEILKSTGVEQFAVEQYVLGIDAQGNFKAYINKTASEILADGSIYALTGFVPLIDGGEAVGESVLSICPHYNIRHPRQIIGRLANCDYFTFACDGRTDGENGMTLQECIDTIMDDLNVEFAFNLDGGGSTQSVVGKKLVNRMLDNRKLPNVIAFG